MPERTEDEGTQEHTRPTTHHGVSLAARLLREPRVVLVIGLVAFLVGLFARDAFNVRRDAPFETTRDTQVGHALKPNKKWFGGKGGVQRRLRAVELKVTEFKSEKDASTVERRTGRDFTGDGTVAGVGSLTPLDASLFYGTFDAPRIDRKGGTIDLVADPSTGEIVPVVTLKKFRWFEFPNEWEARVGFPFGTGPRLDTVAWKARPEDLVARLSWTPVSTKGYVGHSISVDYDRLRTHDDRFRYLYLATIRYQAGTWRTY